MKVNAAYDLSQFAATQPRERVRVVKTGKELPFRIGPDGKLCLVAVCIRQRRRQDRFHRQLIKSADAPECVADKAGFRRQLRIICHPAEAAAPAALQFRTINRYPVRRWFNDPTNLRLIKAFCEIRI